MTTNFREYKISDIRAQISEYSRATHVPVLQKEVLQYLSPKPNENFIDATFGEGGHSALLLEKNGPEGKVLGIETDPELYQKLLAAKSREKTDRLILVNDSYVNLKDIVARYNFQPVSGIIFDLGLSSWHLEESGRGFSFLRDEPLDMRYVGGSKLEVRSSKLEVRSSKLEVGSSKLTAEKIVNNYSEEELQNIFKEYGEERFSRRIAEKIVGARKIKPIRTTFQLVEIIKTSVPRHYECGRIHPATRIFQALRIAVNNELDNLEKSLPQTLEVLEKGGRLVVISFHSLEDRLTKNFLREGEKKNLLKILTKKPIGPQEAEIKINYRSRSAKLRAAVKI